MPLWPERGHGKWYGKPAIKREREIVLLIADGRTNREIAAQLNISEQTVKTHISRIFGKADVVSRTQLAPLALKFK